VGNPAGRLRGGEGPSLRCRIGCCRERENGTGRGNAAGWSEVGRPVGHGIRPAGRETRPGIRITGPKGRLTRSEERAARPSGRIIRPLGPITGPSDCNTGPSGRTTKSMGRITGSSGRTTGPRVCTTGPSGRTIGPLGRVVRPEGRIMRERSVVLHGAIRAVGERYFVLQKRRSVSHRGSPMLQERLCCIGRRAWLRESTLRHPLKPIP
jgi:hypothetical protein